MFGVIGRAVTAASAQNTFDPIRSPGAPVTQASTASSDDQRTARIKAAIRLENEHIRQKYPILRHQDALGASVMALSVLGMIACGWAYAAGLMPWWLCIPVSAVFASFIHELEHDLIHTMYFRNTPWAYNLMMALCWITRPSTISPWVRKRLHLHHHKFSGTESDLEERGITNGERWGLKRLLMTGDHMLAIYLRPLRMRQMVKLFIRAQQPKTREEAQRLVREQTSSFFPLGLLHYTLWHGFLLWHAVDFVAAASGHALVLPAWGASLVAAVNFLVVVWLAPNVLRVFCLHFVSSNMHYYGDVESGNVIQQTQVLYPWWLLPAQLFCFNFGATHAIHHFVVKEPFYIRQLSARAAYPVMRENGVRFNDVGSFRRANRWAAARDAVAVNVGTAQASQ